ncbi:hypothetical protein PsWM33_02694 [Pseudovibrio sp. WM33]|nr:hypothetical protein PsWM33_02694 [Pseudovibrio sp. WM33]
MIGGSVRAIIPSEQARANKSQQSSQRTKERCSRPGGTVSGAGLEQPERKGDKAPAFEDHGALVLFRTLFHCYSLSFKSIELS